MESERARALTPRKVGRVMVLLAPQTVAQQLGLSCSRVQQLDREGRLPAMRDSVGRRLYDPEAVERFASDRKRRKGQKAGSRAAQEL